MPSQENEALLRDKRANSFDAWYEKATGRYHWFAEKKAIIRMLDPQKGDTVIDLGCGTGRFAVEELSERVNKVIALDFSPASVELLNEKIKKERLANIKTLVWDIRKPLPVERCSVDRIVGIQVMPHMPDREKEEVMKNIYEAMKPGGTALITMFSRISLWNHWHALRTGKKLLKEGFWADGSLYYSRSDVPETKSLFLRAGFRDIVIRGCVNLPLYRRLDIKALAMLDIFISRLGISNMLGQYLVCKGIK